MLHVRISTHVYASVHTRVRGERLVFVNRKYPPPSSWTLRHGKSFLTYTLSPARSLARSPKPDQNPSRVRMREPVIRCSELPQRAHQNAKERRDSVSAFRV